MKMNMKEINLNEMEKAAGAVFPGFPEIPDRMPAPINPFKPDIGPFPEPEKPIRITDLYFL